LEIDRNKEPIRYAREVVSSAPFAELLGIELEEVRDSYARARLLIKEEHCNAEGRTHGALIFALADQAFGVACNSRGFPAFGIEVKINYFEATFPGDVVVAEVTPLDIRTRVSLWNIIVSTEDGRKIAAAHGLAYHVLEPRGPV
jgi:acyl-CoA thioesterase